ncbi:hypothetical protein A9Q81_23820 [Gammaproteobacteria bacterium 42_54_T18]|nr:hypothetical protein A9Q81_23820 [Gammaproteobacteria bacterium 42_54_T18]
MTKPLLWIVDDEEDITEIIAVTGESIGFECKTTTSARSFQRNYDPSSVAAVVMDIVMPEMDGNELLQWLAVQDVSPPIVLISGYGGAYLSVAEKLGETKGAVIVGSLLKPLNLGDLRQILKEIYSAQY